LINEKKKKIPKKKVQKEIIYEAKKKEQKMKLIIQMFYLALKIKIENSFPHSRLSLNIWVIKMMDSEFNSIRFVKNKINFEMCN